jgi:hypothetical protein
MQDGRTISTDLGITILACPNPNSPLRVSQADSPAMSRQEVAVIKTALTIGVVCRRQVNYSIQGSHKENKLAGRAATHLSSPGIAESSLRDRMVSG